MSGSISLPPLYTEMRVKIDGFKSEMDKVAHFATAKATEITRSMDKANRAADKMVSFGKKATLAVTAPIAAAGVAAFKFAKDYESAFAGVRKTTDATEEEYQKLSNGIRKMSKEMPASAVSIAEVAEAAGQLGIKKDDILNFSKTMVNLGVSTNLSATEAATALARFSNIMGTSSDNVERLGSTIVHLGNNTATTEKEIVDMAMRLAGAGKQVGLTEAQVLGLSAAMSSVGIEAEMGGSAMSKLLVQMKLATAAGGNATQELARYKLNAHDVLNLSNKNSKAFKELAISIGMTPKKLKDLAESATSLNRFSAVANMTADEFKQAFEKDAVGALQIFLKGLKEAEKEGVSAIELLDDMGIKEVRLRDTILRAAEANELFGKTQDLANQGWKENTALQKEAEQRYKTTASQLQIAKNKVVDIAISLGQHLLPKVNMVLGVVGKFTDVISKMNPTLQSVIGWTALAAASIGPLAIGIGKGIKVFTTFKKGISATSIFIKSFFNKDLKGLATQSETTASTYSKSSKKMIVNSERVKSSFTQIGNGFKVSANNVVTDSGKIINSLRQIQLEAEKTAMTLKVMDSTPQPRKSKVAGNKNKRPNRKVRKDFDSKGIDIYTTKTKKLGDTAKNTSRDVKNLGESSTKASTVIRTGATKVATATGEVARKSSTMTKVLSKGSQAIKVVGKGALTLAPLLLDVGLGMGGTATAAASMGGGLLAGAGALGSLAVAAAPVVAGVAAVAAVGYGVYHAFTEHAVPAVDLYKTKTEMVFNEATGRMEQHVVKISEETKKEYQHFYDMSTNIRQAAEGMYIGLYQNADEGHKIILQNAEQFKNDYIAKVNQNKDESIQKFNELFGSSSDISSEMKANLIKDAQETAQESIKSAEERYTEITRLSEELKNSVGEKADQLKRRIIQLTDEQDVETIKILSKNKAEQELLFNNLYESTDTVTREHVANMITKMNELRDNSVKAAEETKDKQIRFAEEWKAQKEIINGKLTEDEERTYKKMKEAAIEGYGKATNEAENLRIDGLKRLEKEYGDFDGSLDINTGKVKSWARQAAESIGLVNRTSLEDKSAVFRINYQVVEETMRLENRQNSNGGRSSIISYHYNGLDYVPYDGYNARLHRGERVLTAEENKEYTNGQNGNILVTIDKVYNNTQNDIRKIAHELGIEVRKQRLGGGIA